MKAFMSCSRRVYIVAFGNLPIWSEKASMNPVACTVAGTFIHAPSPTPDLSLSTDALYHAPFFQSEELWKIPDPHISCWGLAIIHSLGLLGTVHCTYWRLPLPRWPNQTELNKIQSYFSHRKMIHCFVYQGWINEILTNKMKMAQFYISWDVILSSVTCSFTLCNSRKSPRVLFW